MFKKDITYTTFDGEEITESFYFNLDVQELTQLALKFNGGYVNYIRQVMDSHEYTKIGDLFNEFIEISYGVKSPDGKFFRKVDPVDHHKYFEDFKACGAYSAYYLELITDNNAAVEFINSIIPQADIDKIAKQIEAKQQTIKA